MRCGRSCGWSGPHRAGDAGKRLGRGTCTACGLVVRLRRWEEQQQGLPDAVGCSVVGLPATGR